jgi:pimeloyl-ACP methyl ester carboxylesterase
LIIAGLRDHTLAPAEAELAARHISGARLVRLANAGHEVADDQPATLAQLVCEFLA